MGAGDLSEVRYFTRKWDYKYPLIPKAHYRTWPDLIMILECQEGSYCQTHLLAVKASSKKLVRQICNLKFAFNNSVIEDDMQMKGYI